MDFTNLNNQIDNTIRVMAGAVAQLSTHVSALQTANPDVDVAALNDAIARLKAGTDQLAAAVAASKQAVA